VICSRTWTVNDDIPFVKIQFSIDLSCLFMWFADFNLAPSRKGWNISKIMICCRRSGNFNVEYLTFLHQLTEIIACIVWNVLVMLHVTLNLFFKFIFLHVFVLWLSCTFFFSFEQTKPYINCHVLIRKKTTHLRLLKFLMNLIFSSFLNFNETAMLDVHAPHQPPPVPRLNTLRSWRVYSTMQWEFKVLNNFFFMSLSGPHIHTSTWNLY
jgi:hypothetical protein